MQQIQSDFYTWLKKNDVPHVYNTSEAITVYQAPQYITDKVNQLTWQALGTHSDPVEAATIKQSLWDVYITFHNDDEDAHYDDRAEYEAYLKQEHNRIS